MARPTKKCAGSAFGRERGSLARSVRVALYLPMSADSRTPAAPPAYPPPASAENTRAAYASSSERVGR